MQPRERYLRDGPERLADAELIQLVLGTGGRGHPVQSVARALLDRFGGVSGLARTEPGELLGVLGIGPAQAARLHAAVTLGRRASAGGGGDQAVIRGLEDAIAVLAPRLRGLPYEELHAAFLDRRHRVIAWRALTRGSDAFTVVDPRQVFRVAMRVGASALVLAHNHPSGDATPSAADIEVTRRVDRGGRVLGVRLLDHLVVGAADVVSLASEGVLSCWVEGPVSTSR